MMLTTTAAPEVRGTALGSLYPPGMAKRVLLSVQDLRSRIGKLMESIAKGEHIVLSYRGRIFAVITPAAWYREAAEKMGDPTEY